MGAGRKKETVHAADKYLPPLGANSIDTARNLAPNDLAAVIFGCKHNTIEECFANELFGLPYAHHVYVRNIKPGLPLFLFNYSDRKLHGIFEAVCPGRLNINPHAWTEDGSDSSHYPAQVKFRIRTHCQPLREDQFGSIIAKNYYASRLFWFELDKNQANKLISLFSSSPMTLKEINHHRTLFGSNVRGKQQLQCQIHDNEEKQKKEVVYANTSSGISYSSVVRNKNSSVACKDQSYVKMGTYEHKPDKAWSLLGDSNVSDSSCPTIAVVGTSQKTWSGLFDKETVPDAKSRTEDSKIPTSELTDSYWDQPNSQWEPSPYNHVSEAPIGDDCGNCGAVVVGDTRLEADDFGLPQEQNKRPWSSSCGSPSWDDSWDEEKQPAEVHKNELDCEYSLYASMANMVLLENGLEEVADDVKSRGTTVSDVEPPEFRSMLSKLLLEVQELKESQSMQSQKISLLEQELITSRHEIQELKDTQKMLKSSNLNLGDLIFIAGGFDGSAWFSSLDSYSPFEDLRKPLASMSSSRAHASAVNLNGQLYVLGGMQGHCLYDKVESYNPTSNKWVSHPPLNQKKGHTASVSLENKIYSIGGGSEVDHYAEVEMLDVNAERWIPVRSMLEKRYAPAAAELGGVVYVVGGYNAMGLLDSVERYDPREPAWAKLANMTSRRGFHSVVVLNDKLYALGGFDGQKMLSSVEIFDPRLGFWISERSMRTGRGYFGAFVIRDAIYAMGGLSGTPELSEELGVIDTVECYKEACGWQLTDLKGVGKRSFFAGAVL
ncbi:uncharacterized protein [Euphorbia lathyris]|uniref:uncharacterized protein n=1 Tax=Euphorbia lathyris TaxID=212925 RepID=UPI003313D4A7